MRSWIGSMLWRVGLINEKDINRKGYFLRSKKNDRSIKLKRGYDAGRPGRNTPTRLFGNNSINSDVRNYMSNARSNADEQLKNSGVARGLMIHREANLLGENGFVLQSLATKPDGTPDTKVRKIIEDGFKSWSNKEHCTMSKKHSFIIVQLINLWNYKRDGEIINRTVLDPENEYGISLQLIDPRDLDESYNDTSPTGNEIVMGIEFDKWEREVAFYFKKKDSYGRQKKDTLHRILAEEIIHTFKPEHVKQRRGFTHFATALAVINGIGDWIGAMLDKAINNAANLGFMTKRADMDAPEYKGDGADRIEKTTDEDGSESSTPIWDTEKGTYRFLPEGYDLSETNDNFPSTSHTSFVATAMRILGLGTGDDYSEVANDRSNENYSSLRSGKLTAQSVYKVEQTVLIEMYYVELFKRWIRSAVVAGALEGLTYAKIDEYLKHLWQPKTYPWVDPMKDVQALALEITLGLKSRTQGIRERYGKDITDVRKEIEQERKDDETAGLNFQEIKEVSTSEETEGDNKKKDDDDKDEGNNSKTIFKMKLG